MAIIFRKVTLRSRLNPETCIRRLRNRNSKAKLLPFSDITNSILYKRYVLSTMRPLDWSNKGSEPTFIGLIRAQATGSTVRGYIVPGLAMLFVPILLPLLILLVIIWLGTAWFAPLDVSMNPVQHYLTLAVITVGVLAILVGITRAFRPDRWNEDQLIEKLARVLDADIAKNDATGRGE